MGCACVLEVQTAAKCSLRSGIMPTLRTCDPSLTIRAKQCAASCNQGVLIVPLNNFLAMGAAQAPSAEWTRRRTSNPKIAGSSPAGDSSMSAYLAEAMCRSSQAIDIGSVALR